MSELVSGIYKLTCQKTGRYYIGQSVNVQNRVRQHMKALEKGAHHNTYLQAVWSKHHSITLDQVIYCPEDELDELEQLCVDTADSNLLMNICREVVTSQKGTKRSPEVGQKISNAKKGKTRPPFSEEWLKNLKAAQQARTRDIDSIREKAYTQWAEENRKLEEATEHVSLSNLDDTLATDDSHWHSLDSNLFYKEVLAMLTPDELAIMGHEMGLENINHYKRYFTLPSGITTHQTYNVRRKELMTKLKLLLT